MFSNILVALDGSQVSQRAFSEAFDQARVWHAKIHVIYVIQSTISASNPMDQPFGRDSSLEMYQFLEEEGIAVLKEAKKYCADNGISIGTHLKQGDAGIEIISLAEQEKCDLIVVASHGKSNIDRLLLGSVSSFVVTHNKVTTLVVRG